RPSAGAGAGLGYQVRLQCGGKVATNRAQLHQDLWGWRRRSGRMLFNRVGLGMPLRKQLLNALDRIALTIEELIDTGYQRYVIGSVIAPIAGTLQRPKLRKARFPIAQDVLGNAELIGNFADCSQRAFCLYGRIGHVRSISYLALAIVSRRSCDARKVRTRLGAIGTSIPVLGLRPTRWPLSRN